MEGIKVTLPIVRGAGVSGKALSFIIFIMVISSSGCATQSKIGISPVMQKSAIIFQNGDFAVYEIPSYGAISDALSISTKGGRHAKNLSVALASLSKSSNGNIVVYSTNPNLSHAAISGAITDKQLPNIWLIYAGSRSNSELLSALAKRSDMKYSFIDIIARDPD